MLKKITIIILIILPAIPALSQNKQESALKREITLYNPYKPSLPDVVKKSFLPDMTDTARVRPDFRYEVKTYPFMPPYKINPVRAASMVPDPLPKLYNSFVSAGFGSHLTPVAEISISNQRSKKGNIGFYGRHFSTNDNIELENGREGFAGYMDNELLLYGRRIMKKSVFEASAGYSQKSRHAYGYDTRFSDYSPEKEDIRLNYNDLTAGIRLISSNPDSSDLSYDFGLSYGYFFTLKGFNQHMIDFKARMAKPWKEFYIGSGAGFRLYLPSDSVIADTSMYLVSLNPFVMKRNSEWEVKLGFTFMAEKLFGSTRIHIYPDIRFGFSIIPSYLRFTGEIGGGLEENRPTDAIAVNPYLFPGEAVYRLKNSDRTLMARIGFTGETGIKGRYNLWGSYSFMNDMLLYSNYIVVNSPDVLHRGQYFKPLYDDAEILNLHGDISGELTDKISFSGSANLYRYTMTRYDYAYNMPGWDARVGLSYNLRDKILAGFGAKGLGSRMALVTTEDQSGFVAPSFETSELPFSLSFDLSAEYRYTRILSFWLKLDNISFSRQYEWAFYPSQRFFLIAGFKYSL